MPSAVSPSAGAAHEALLPAADEASLSAAGEASLSVAGEASLSFVAAANDAAVVRAARDAVFRATAAEPAVRAPAVVGQRPRLFGGRGTGRFRLPGRRHGDRVRDGRAPGVRRVCRVRVLVRGRRRPAVAIPRRRLHGRCKHVQRPRQVGQIGGVRHTVRDGRGGRPSGRVHQRRAGNAIRLCRRVRGRADVLVDGAGPVLTHGVSNIVSSNTAVYFIATVFLFFVSGRKNATTTPLPPAAVSLTPIYVR